MFIRCFLGLTTLCLLSAPAVASHAMVQSGSTVAGYSRPVQTAAVRIVAARLTVTFDSGEGRGDFRSSMPAARVRVEYDLANPTDQKQVLNLAFPVQGAPLAGRAAFAALASRTPDLAGFQVSLDGRPLAVRAEPLPGLDPFRGVRPESDQQARERAARYAAALRQWRDADPVLRGYMAEYARLRAAAPEYERHAREFEAAARRHLLEQREAYRLLRFAQGETDLGTLVALIPEVDSSLRIDQKRGALPYLTLLNVYEPEAYRAYEQEWRKKIDDWIAARPDLAKHVGPLREGHKSLTASRNLLTGAVLAHLHDVCGLPLPIAANLAGYLGNALDLQVPPPLDVLEELLPEAARELDQWRRDRGQLLGEWDMDQSFISPLTGQLYRQRKGWRDDSVDALIGSATQPVAPGSAGAPADAPPRSTGSLTLMHYAVELAPNASATLRVDDETLTGHDEALYLTRAAVAVPQFTHILRTARYFADFGPIAITVRVPRSVLALIWPQPQEVDADDVHNVYRLTVVRPDQNLHVGLLRRPEGESESSSLIHLLPADQATLAALERLAPRVTHPAARPVAQSLLASVRARLGRRYAAYAELLNLQKQYPDFPVRGFVFAELREFQGARRIYEFVETVARDWRIDLDKRDAPNHWEPLLLGRDYRFLSADDRAHLIRRMSESGPAEPTAEQRLTRAFVLCQCDVDRQANLRQFIEIAQANPAVAALSLRLLEALQGDKHQAMDYLMRQASRPPPEPPNTYVLRPTLRRALGQCASAEDVPRLIELMKATEEPAVLVGALEALGRIGPDPAHFDDLNALMPKAERMRVFNSLADALLAADTSKAIPILHQVLEQDPKRADALLPRLARAGDKSILPMAVDLYHKHDVRDAFMFSSILTALCAGQDPAIISQLTYRRGLDAFSNARLLELPLTPGDRAAFDFAVEYYNEHVKGKAPNAGNISNHINTLRRAFARLGDPRAVPYLRAMAAEHPDQFHSIAQTIGELILDRRRTPSADELSLRNALSAAMNDDSAAAAAAIEELRRRADEVVAHLRAIGAISSTTVWDQGQVRQWKRVLPHLGPKMMTFLLEQSRGAGPATRRSFAGVLAAFPEDQRAPLRDAARAGLDPDQRITALLALGEARDAASLPLLRSALGEPRLRFRAIDALELLGSAEARAVLADFSAALAATPAPTPLDLRCAARARQAAEAISSAAGPRDAVGGQQSVP